MLVDFLNDYYQANLKSIHDVAGNQHLVGNSKVFHKPLFVKIFKEKAMFYAEQHVNQFYYPDIYLDSVIFEDKYVVTLRDRNLKDVDNRRMTPEMAYEYGKLLGSFHRKVTGNVSVEDNRQPLSQLLTQKVEQLQGSLYYENAQKVLELLKSDFNKDNLEYEQLPKVVLHGDFSVRNIMEFEGKDILIDFERSHVGTSYQDFIKFFYNEVRDVKLRNEFLRGYEQEYPFEIPSSDLQRCLLFLCALDISQYNITHSGGKFGDMASNMIATIKDGDAVLKL
ncbi:aminoglycoside phosphotransferase family protein [Liquorilactobacillus mali]|uniref:phosphotransferase n=1 Tax=Liquorilactobacillus mali TaxID=1618 RepID=UPI0023506E3D|nr:aminoglycoside phosphotransferase family protein [Liquorilactobacillus mali]MDC7952067.1 phosphotransferase [Liquorilactobacillus mali]